MEMPLHRPKCLDNQQLHTIQDKLKQKNELPLGSRDREDLVNEIKNQVSMGSCARSLNKNSYNALSIRCATRRRRHFVVHARTTPVFLQKNALRPSNFLKQRRGSGDKFHTEVTLFVGSSCWTQLVQRRSCLGWRGTSATRRRGGSAALSKLQRQKMWKKSLLWKKRQTLV